jgi:hypothetical protein
LSFVGAKNMIASSRVALAVDANVISLRGARSAVDHLFGKKIVEIRALAAVQFALQLRICWRKKLLFRPRLNFNFQLTVVLGDPLAVRSASTLLVAALLLAEVLLVVGTVLCVARVVAHALADAVVAAVLWPRVVAFPL